MERKRDKDLAIQIAADQVAILQRLLQLREQNPDLFEQIGGYTNGEDISLNLTEATLQGVDNVKILFEHDLVGTKNYREKVGIDTSTALYVGLYTDRETWKVVREKEAYDWQRQFGFPLEEIKVRLAGSYTPEQIDEMTFPSASSFGDYGTYYFVDLNGNFAKVISIPEELANGRTDLQIEGYSFSTAISVEVPMQPRDFVIIKNALVLLQRRVASAQEQQ